MKRSRTKQNQNHLKKTNEMKKISRLTNNEYILSEIQSIPEAEIETQLPTDDGLVGLIKPIKINISNSITPIKKEYTTLKNVTQGIIL